jgi:predicted secreted hydrolase
MFYQLRRTDGSADPASAGTFVDAEGETLHLDTGDVRIDVLDTWSSPQGGTYPARWQLTVPRLGLDVIVTPILADQELFTTVRYWEGAVDVEGNGDAAKLAGRGYVELTGYAQ